MVRSLQSSLAHIVAQSKSAHHAPSRQAAARGEFAAVLNRAAPATASGTSAINPAATPTQISAPSLIGAFAPPAVTPVTVAAAAPAAPAPSSVPTLQSVFGATPWLDNPIGRDAAGNPFSFNRIYFATQQTAEKVAQMTGGTVVVKNAILSNGPITQGQPNYMVQLPNGAMINPGLVASFYTHGYPQSYIDQLLSKEFGGVSA